MINFIKLQCSHCRNDFERPKYLVRGSTDKHYCSKDCRLDGTRKSLEERIANKRANAEAWRKANPERVRANAKAWRDANPDRVAASKAEHWQRHGEKVNAKRREWRAVNPEEAHKKDRLRYEKNGSKVREYMRRFRAENPETIKRQREEHRINNRPSLMWSHTKKAARVAGVEFDLTREWFQERLDAGVCELSGLPFDLNGRRTANSPSVDRRIAGGPYTMANCRLVFLSVNKALSNYGDDYMLTVFKAIIDRR